MEQTKIYQFPEVAPMYPNVTHKAFVRGYKKMKALEMIKANGGARYVDIIKVLYELSYGPNTYSSTDIKSRGYSVGLFSNPHQNTWPYFSCDKVGKLYVINERGEKELEKLQEKFN